MPAAFRGRLGKCGSRPSWWSPLWDWARAGGTSDQCLSDLTLESEMKKSPIFFFLILSKNLLELSTERTRGLAMSDTDFRPGLQKSILLHCTMVPLSTRSCLKSNKLRPILNGQFYHAIFKNIGLNLFGSKQPREILVFVILKLWFRHFEHNLLQVVATWG